MHLFRKPVPQSIYFFLSFLFALRSLHPTHSSRYPLLPLFVVYPQGCFFLSLLLLHRVHMVITVSLRNSCGVLAGLLLPPSVSLPAPSLASPTPS